MNRPLNIHREANSTLLGEKILVVHSGIIKGPKKYATRGRHNAQYVIVTGGDEPAFAIIDKKLHYVKNR